MSWLPEMARLRPQRFLRFEYRSPSRIVQEPHVTVAQALDQSGLEWHIDGPGAWGVLLPSATRVYGFVPREIDEACRVLLTSDTDAPRLALECRPTELHAAHATGLGGVLALAAVVWVAGGLSGGVLPALTTVIAGGLFVEVTRHWALEALERQLRGLTGEIGRSLWPSGQAQILVSIEPVS